MTKKIGFACKLSEFSVDHGVCSIPQYNSCGTTITWLNRQTRAVAEQRLWDLMVHNIAATLNLVKYVGNLDDSLRMVRLSSDILPAGTEPTWCYFWQLPDVRLYAERAFMEVGEHARRIGVRVSFHPGQFCVLASDNPDIVRRSLEEFEYHADMARYMGYGQQFQDLKINVHIAGRAGPQGIRQVLTRMTPEARNCITIENEEMRHGLDDCLTISDCVPIVLDLHHHWVREGQYMAPDDVRVARILDSWRGVRPTCHYSVSREDVLPDHSPVERPHMPSLLESGHKKSKLRAHSDFYWNSAVNDWALQFLEHFDIMCESKAKNLASFALHERARELELV